ncbi:MAG: GNAT family N-acetyltransferase [Sedimentisphaerales bacterium]|nr:GNAT family N-acetyltransferase [Sedimentisphaerales bacterium]
MRALLDAAWTSYPNAVSIEIRDVAETVSPLAWAQGYWHLQIGSRSGRYLRVDGDQDQYQASLSRNFRSNQRKAENKLRRLAGVEVAFVTAPDASSAQLAEFVPVEAAGWKGRDGTAIQKASELIAFYTTLTTRLAKAGWLEWHFLRAEGQVIAANLAVRFNRSIIVWKLGYDEGYRQCSPGGMLFQSLLDRAFADPDIDEVNLLTDASWYDNWRMDERTYYRIRFYRNRRPLSLFLGAVPDRIVSVPRRSRALRSIGRAGWRCMQHFVRRPSLVEDGNNSR